MLPGRTWSHVQRDKVRGEGKGCHFSYIIHWLGNIWSIRQRMAEHCFGTLFINLISYYNNCNMYIHTTYPHLPLHSPPPFTFFIVFLSPSTELFHCNSTVANRCSWLIHLCCGINSLSMDGFLSPSTGHHHLETAQSNMRASEHLEVRGRKGGCTWVCCWRDLDNRFTIHRDKQCLSSKRLKLCRCNGKQRWPHSTNTSSRLPLW